MCWVIRELLSVILYYVLWSILTLLRHKVHTKMKDIWCNCESKERLLPISEKSLFDTRWHQFFDSRWNQRQKMAFFLTADDIIFFDKRWHHFLTPDGVSFLAGAEVGRNSSSSSTYPNLRSHWVRGRMREKLKFVCLFVWSFGS